VEDLQDPVDSRYRRKTRTTETRWVLATLASSEDLLRLRVARSRFALDPGTSFRCADGP
jgi:hypothetical protein